MARRSHYFIHYLVSSGSSFCSVAYIWQGTYHVLLQFFLTAFTRVSAHDSCNKNSAGFWDSFTPALYYAQSNLLEITTRSSHIIVTIVVTRTTIITTKNMKPECFVL